MKMKWKSRSKNDGDLGLGYECGEYIIEETFDSYNLQKKYGGRKADYYWKLTKGSEIIKYAKTAKALKQYAETL